jgi:hypothetical protein
MEKVTFTRACLSIVRVIMGIYACTLARVATSSNNGIDSCTRVPTARHAWGLQPCPIVSFGKCRRFPRLHRLVNSTRYWKLMDKATGSQGPSPVEEGGGLGRQVVKYCLPMSTVMRNKDGANCSCVQFFLGWWLLLFNQE